MVCIRSQCTYHFLRFWKGLDHIFFTAILTYLLTITWLVACINNLLMIIPSWSDGLMTIIIKCNSPFLNSDGVIMSWEAVQMNYLWHLQLRLFCVCVCVSMCMSHYHAAARLNHFEETSHFASSAVHMMGTVRTTLVSQPCISIHSLCAPAVQNIMFQWGHGLMGNTLNQFRSIHIHLY